MSKLSVSNKKIDTILVLDFGSQYTQLIARRIRESDVYSEILPWDIDESKIINLNPKGVILSGGPNSVTESYTPRIPQCIFDLTVPILGICYGMQTLAEQMGGHVISADQKEFGHSELEVVSESIIFKNLNKKINVWMSHGDQVQDLPDDFNLTASTATAPIAAMEHKDLPIYAIQFHPEVTHTDDGQKILENFIFGACKAKTDWKMNDLISERVKEIKEQVQDNKVLLGLSGGVDSSVTAALLHKAIGKKLTCVFVDNGLLRKNEANQVMQTFADNMNLNVIKSDSEDIFLRHLKSIDDPEQKRKVIGRTFIDIFDAEAIKLKDIKFLAQGTIYPDVIESSSKDSKSDVIKSHHNVGGLPKRMQFKLVEPIKLLFKDEVRRIGRALKIPKNLIERHPFPGPGLAVRIIGEVSEEKVNILQEVDHIFIEELKKNNLYNKISQALAVFLPIKSVGVMGDQRQYSYVVALRAVRTIDFMTASVSEIPYNILNIISTRIVNEVNGVSRVVYDITSKPPGTIEWE